MRGRCGIRAWWVLCAVLVTAGGSGCHHFGGVETPEKRTKALLYQSDTHGPPAGAHTVGDPPSRGGGHTTTERIHGGII